MKRRILHVITGLPVGGAQAMLLKLLSRSDRAAFEPEVVSLLERGPMASAIAALDVRVRALDLPKGVPPVAGFLRLARWLRREPVDIIQCWMYHADLIGGLAARLAGIRRIVWGIRQSAPDPRGTKRSTLWTVGACARLSRRIPSRIVCCSEAARRDHVALGYDAAKMVVIPNGFDLEAFGPDPAARREVRTELGLDETTPLVGLVARFHPQKDHRTFLEAARAVSRAVPAAHFLLCGEDVDAANHAIAGQAAARELGGRLHVLGERRDVPRLTAAFDVACSSSAFAEGFPNTIGEAMACGVPCVVTDVGESAALVGETGRVVRPEDPGALASAIAGLLSASPLERERLGAAARARVAERYSLPAVVRRYEALYEEVLAS